MKEALLIIIITIAFGLFINFMFSQGERRECEQWLKQSKEIPGYYVTDWQYQQCKQYGITFSPTLLIPKNK